MLRRELGHKVGVRVRVTLTLTLTLIRTRTRTLTLTRTRTLTLTLGNPEPCHLVYTWLVKELVLRRKAGGIATDAPVVSRIYQVKGWG